jgi:hypothetical protein
MNDFHLRQVAPKPDMCGAAAYIRYGRKADIRQRDWNIRVPLTFERCIIFNLGVFFIRRRRRPWKRAIRPFKL